jgi:Uma2 family endonuclease
MSSPATASESAWARVLRDPQLRDLPYKVETNGFGQIVLSPHTPYHSLLQSQIYDALKTHVDRPGRPTTEFAVATDEGVKVPDVVWLSRDRFRQVPPDADASPVMPEICVEVLSESNTEGEIAEKRWLYLREGAKEVWTCDEDGSMTFYDANGQRDASLLAPSFPPSVAIEE